MTSSANPQANTALLKNGSLLADHALTKNAENKLSGTEVLIYSALLPNHPRAFWNACGSVIDSPNKNLEPMFNMAANDERALRLCCGAFRKLFTNAGSRNAPDSQSVSERLANAKSLLLAIIDFPNKDEAWRDARLLSLEPAMKMLAAKDIAILFGVAASRDFYSCCKIIASCLPSSTLGAPRSATRSFYKSSLDGRAAERRRLAALRSGEAHPMPANSTFPPTDPFFWIGAMKALDGKTCPSRAPEWLAMAEAFIKAGIGRSFLFEAMSPGLAQMALDSPETLDTPSFYVSERTETLAEAFFLADDAMAANIAQYDALTSASKEPQINAKGQSFAQLPAEAIALLAGRVPSPQRLAELGETKFLLSSKVVRETQEFHAAGGSCESVFARILSQDSPRRSYTMSSLAAALGITLPSPRADPGSLEPTAKPSMRARRSP